MPTTMSGRALLKPLIHDSMSFRSKNEWSSVVYARAFPSATYLASRESLDIGRSAIWNTLIGKN